MLLVDNTNIDPYFNIATEEYLLRNKQENFFLVYSNSNSIIIGKHQNAMSEINYLFVKKNNIPVVRRLSGGGTVYHDTGNLNFCFILTGNSSKLSDFAKYTEPIINFLREEYSLQTYFNGRNSLLCNGFKISGNSEHIYKNRIIHHGTLLFSADLELLDETLKVNPNKYNDKKLKSVRSDVANISELANTLDSIDIFKKKLINFIKNYYNSVAQYKLNDKDTDQIEKLVDNKYSKWEWNYAYHADYEFTNETQIKSKTLYLNLIVSGGFIKTIKVNYGNYRLTELEDLLINQKHKIEDINFIISNANFDLMKYDLAPDEFIHSLF